jgi:hypothetical protein
MKATIRNKLIAQLVEAGYITRWQVAVKLNDKEPEVFKPMFHKNIETGKVLLDQRPAYLKASA